ncbi:hypothetical protein AB0D04_08820 [Streptomyces sp. NPDC048483]|uniref:hypothetical protein n=1 Tax=Streptomyces sp. NPDC048483 TaxID=3154927 RepID=UPI003441D073
MEAELTALAEAATDELAAAARTDRWDRLRDALVDGLLPAGAGQADRQALTAEFESVRDALRAPVSNSPAGIVQATAVWRGRIRQLLAESPDAAPRVRALLNDLRPYGGQSISMGDHNVASDVVDHRTISHGGGHNTPDGTTPFGSPLGWPPPGNTPPGPPFGDDEEDEW